MPSLILLKSFILKIYMKGKDQKENVKNVWVMSMMSVIKGLV